MSGQAITAIIFGDLEYDLYNAEIESMMIEMDAGLVLIHTVARLWRMELAATMI